MNYIDYVKGIEKCNITSPLESSYQEVLSSFFKDELKDKKIDVIVSKDFPGNSTLYHCTDGYKKPGTASPDLILAKNFYYYNLDDKTLPEVDYYALVEVKKPNTIKINGQFITLKSHDENQLKTYLEHPSINKLIFTDGYAWVFYYKEFDCGPQKIIEFKDGKNWKFSEGNLKPDNNNLCEPKEWKELQSYISNFLDDTQLVNIQERKNICND